MSNNDPMEPLKILCERLERIAQECGLQLHTFAVLPNLEGGPHMVQAMLIFDDKALPAAGQTSSVPERERVDDADAKQINEAFEAMMKGQQKSEEEQKMEQAAESARKMAEDLMRGQMPSNDPPEEAAS